MEHLMGRRRERNEQQHPSFYKIKLEPLNELQKKYISAVYHSSVVLAIGVLGSAKTFIPTSVAVQMLLDKRIDRIIVARPAEGKAKSVGFLKGDKNEKMLPWCQPVINTIKHHVGDSMLQMFLASEKVELLPLEMVKGRTFDNSFVIVDEAEDLDISTAKSLVTRHGSNSKMVITGDVAQKDIRQHSGLEYLIDVIYNSSLNVPIIDFNSWDYCVRSEEAKMWGMAFQQYDRSAR
jgi:phosphate starvation-inducible protein PhoH and related proteins